ncbi:WXG100 family type VII secretion target [Georgenia subflava]|uniref:ESAT-6-like protein n=1 Tax=Georgenia subflava TaxID=1622177 RepID=A0A6N7EPM8_9MICO|nr:WXG100 family type VII secretion target [Georgenia subflava]MPV37174.1 WXG100 family type VII secretion target [Georgenia subflava]
MSNINVSYDEMEREANSLATAKEQIIGDLNRLQSQIQSLVDSGFVTDQASVRFNESYQQFTQGAQSTIEGLQDLSAYLTNAANALRDTDSQLAAGI